MPAEYTDLKEANREIERLRGILEKARDNLLERTKAQPPSVKNDPEGLLLKALHEARVTEANRCLYAFTQAFSRKEGT